MSLRKQLLVGVGTTLLMVGCNSDATPKPRFTVDSATHTLDSITNSSLEYPGIPGVMNADDDNQNGITDWKEEAFVVEDNDYTSLTITSEELAPVQLRIDGQDVRIWHNGEKVLEDSGSWSPEPAAEVTVYVEFGVLWRVHCSRFETKKLKNKSPRP